MALNEIRRGDTLLAQSNLSDLGYSQEMLRGIEEDGHTVYVDGKPRRKRGQRQAQTQKEL